MLDPTFKSFSLMSSFVGKEQRVAIVAEYARKSLYPMLLKCDDHPLVEIKSSFANIGVDEDYNLDIFDLVMTFFILHIKILLNSSFSTLS